MLSPFPLLILLLPLHFITPYSSSPLPPPPTSLTVSPLLILPSPFQSRALRNMVTSHNSTRAINHQRWRRQRPASWNPRCFSTWDSAISLRVKRLSLTMLLLYFFYYQSYSFNIKLVAVLFLAIFSTFTNFFRPFLLSKFKCHYRYHLCHFEIICISGILLLLFILNTVKVIIQILEAAVEPE